MSGSGIGGTLGTAAAIALAPETGGLSLMLPALGGAAGSALGGYLTGDKNIGRDALLGGIGGGIGGGVNNLFGGAGGLGGLFDSSAKAATEAPEMVAQGFGDNATQLAQGFGSDAVNQGFGSAFTPASSTSSLYEKAKGFAPYAGLGLGSMLLDNSMKPTQPQLQSHPSNPGDVSPLNRTQQSVDPNSYFLPNQNRNYFSDYSMQPQFHAKGGSVKRMKYFSDGGSACGSSSNIPPLRRAGGGMINGAGDGQSDSIPAQLSDGEFVMSAPVVSALGNGSNKAGAKKLGMAQKNILKKHYKGGKPHKAMGLGSYVH